MFIARTKQEIRNFILDSRQGKKLEAAPTGKPSGKIAFIPTMGALHDGHLSLIELGKSKADIVICSIFVNPAQFGANEDLSKYPRTEENDCEMLKKAGCDAVFIPSVEEIYPRSFSLEIKVKNTDILCGKFRPGHFDGVALIVAKLFNIILPDIAIFGEKDYQQLCVIKKMAADLDYNIEILGAPIIRENDGLAMSSRNKYLSAEERNIAAKLNIALKNAAEKINHNPIKTSLEEAKKYLIDSGFSKIDYIEAREKNTLEETKIPGKNTRIFAAGWVGKTRLIDNLKLRS